MTAQRQIFYHGRVQGVGFRYTVKQIAAGYEVIGWVRNLPDGRVELQVQGSSPEVDGFLEAITASELRHHIREQQSGGNTAGLDGARGFEIRY